MRSCTLRVVPKSNKESHYKRQKRKRHRVTDRECHGLIEAEIGAMHLQTRSTKDCWKSPEARKEAWNRFSHRASRSNQACWTF